MVTTAKKKAPAKVVVKAAVKAKPPVVPAKTIANTAAKAAAMRSADELKTPIAKATSKPANKPVNKSATKASVKPAAKSVAKTVAKTAPAIKSPSYKPASQSKTQSKSGTKVTKKVVVKGAARSVDAVQLENGKSVAKKSAPSAKSESNPKEKVRKPKLVRDSFTMPEAEYAVLGEVKKACIAAGIEVKKSQLLRVGLVLLKKTPISTLKNLVENLQTLKAGRPKLG